MQSSRWSWSRPWMVLVAACCGAALTACFADSGVGATNGQSSDGTSTSTSAAETSAGTTDATTTSPTSSSGTASESTGATSTTTVTPTTTGGGCTGECTPGTSEEGEACGCGVELRECQEDCTWSGWVCEGEEACGLWSLPAGANAWEEVPWGAIANPVHAPTSAVEASFGADAADLSVVLTHDTFHVLDVPGRAWTNSGARSDLFPEADGVTLVGAYSVNAGLAQGGPASPKEGLTLLSADRVWLYDDFEPVGLSPKYNSDMPCCGGNEDWLTVDAPDPALVRAFWLDVVGDELWINPDISGCDGLPNGTQMVGYGAALSSASGGTAHVSDVGKCFDFVYSAPLSMYPPMTLPAAPSDVGLVGGAFFLDGIYVVGSNNE